MLLPLGFMPPARTPTYALPKVQGNARAGGDDRFFVRRSAFYDALALGFDQSDIKAAVLELDDGDFFKTMESTAKPGLMQDVYRPRYLAVALYLKVQLDPPERTIVISFKKDQAR